MTRCRRSMTSLDPYASQRKKYVKLVTHLRSTAMIIQTTWTWQMNCRPRIKSSNSISGKHSSLFQMCPRRCVAKYCAISTLLLRLRFPLARKSQKNQFQLTSNRAKMRYSILSQRLIYQMSSSTLACSNLWEQQGKSIRGKKVWTMV